MQRRCAAGAAVRGASTGQLDEGRCVGGPVQGVAPAQSSKPVPDQ